MLGSVSATRYDKLLQRIRQSIADPLDLRQLLLTLITHTSKVLSVENISYLLLNRSGDEYQLKESIKLKKSTDSLSVNSALIQYFQNKRELIVHTKIKQILYQMGRRGKSKQANIDLLEDLHDNLELLGAEIAVPFFKDNDLIGVLCIGNKKMNRPFARTDVLFLNMLAEEFTLMIDSAMRHENLKIKEKETTSLYEVGKVISSLFDFKKTFDIIVRNASILLKAPMVLIILIDDLEGQFMIKKSFGFTDFQLNKIQESVRFKSCTQNIAETTEGILIKSQRENSYYEEDILQELNIESIISVPLFDEDLQIIGELRAMRPSTQQSFIEREVEIASNLANNVMVAVNNSKRYQKSEENLIELSTIYNIIKSLTAEFELEKIQQKVCTIFADVLNFDRSILYIYTSNNRLTARASCGWDMEKYKDLSLDVSKTIEGKALIEGRIYLVKPKDMENYDSTVAKNLGLKNFAVIPLLIINKKPIGALVIDIGEDGQSREKINLRLLSAIANQSAIIIDNARLYAESEELNRQLSKEQARTAKELQIARYIQQGLLSAKLPESKALHIYARNVPCQAVGGDFFNFIPFDEDNLGVVVGDVSGKGIPAALLMTMTNSIFSEYGKRFDSPESIMKHANEALQNYLSRSPIFYVTAFYAMIDQKKNLLRFCKAGHNPPIMYRAKQQEVIFLDGEGTYLGTFNDGGFIEKNIRIESGDKLILYTDGITEVRNDQKKMFSKERLADLVHLNASLPAEKLAALLISEVETFSNNHEFADDITIVIIDFKELRKFTEKILYKINYKIPNSMPEVKKVIKELLKKLEALEINKRVYNHIRLSISESLINALEHGNKSNPKKSITIKGVLTNRRVEFSVTDEGKGFDEAMLTYSENKESITHRGRGITAIKACMDEVFFNDKGNRITLIKYII